MTSFLVFYNSFKKRKGAYFISYTVMFAAVSLLMFFYFPLYHKGFIWQQDGLKQHYNGLLYYSRYLKNIVSTLINEGRLIIPKWDFSIGYGSDIITTLHYYAIGDPLTLLSFFVPLSLMEFFYAFLFFLRAYIGGLGFSLLSLERGNKRFSTLIAALIYCFSAFGLVLGLMHGIFMVPVCYFPWIIYGIDRVFREKSGAVFILSTAAAAAANFYFFYMEIFLAVLYSLHLFWTRKKERASLQEKLKLLFKFLIYGLDAFLLSAVSLLPVLSVMFTSERFSAEKYVPVLYSLKHYLQLIACFMVTRRGGNWTLMGYTVTGALAVLLICSEKNPGEERKGIRYRFLTLTLFAMIPAFGYMLNGFAYVVNRWTFAYALSVAAVTAAVLPEASDLQGERKDRLLRLLIPLCLLSAAFFFVRNEEALLSWLLLLMMVLILISVKRQEKHIKAIILVFTLISLSLNGWNLYSTAEADYLDEFLPFHEADRRLNDSVPSDILNSTGDDSFFRTEIRGLDTTQNSSIQTGFRGTQFYFSLTSPYISDFINSLYFNCPKDYDYDGVESRAGLEGLAAVKYFIAGKDSKWQVPAGFIEVPERDGIPENAVLYKNENALPLGFGTDKIIKLSDFDGSKVTGRQSALLTGAVVSDEDAAELKNKGFQETVFTDDSEDALLNITPEGDMDYSDNSFTVRRNATVTVTFEGRPDSENYLFFKGLEFEGFKEREKYERAWGGLTPYEQAKVMDKNTTDGRPSVSSLMVSAGGNSQIIEFYNKRNDYYCGRKNFLINLGETEGGEQQAIISFREAGVYSFEALEVRSQKVSSITERLNKLKEAPLKDIEVKGDRVSGSFSADSDRLIILSIPYSRGWRAYVDGEREKLFRADLMYMALPVSKGEHRIVLEYETPFLKTGGIMGIFGILLFIIVIIAEKRYDKRYENKNF